MNGSQELKTLESAQNVKAHIGIKSEKQNKEIFNAKSRQYYHVSKNTISEKRKIKYQEKYCDRCLRYAKEYRLKNREKIRQKDKEKYRQNPEKYRHKSKNYNAKNSEKVRKVRKIYCSLNKERLNAASREYAKNHKEDANRRNSIRFKKLRKEDPKFRLRRLMTDGIYRSLKNKCGYSWEKLVGYTFQDLIKHIERQFKPNMNWDNFGQWHVDHIIPQSVFNYDSFTHIDFKKCWALKNLQPLWAKENLKKSAKLDKSFQPSLKLELLTEYLRGKI